MVNIASYWPAWLAIAVAVMVALNQLLSESEKVARLFGRIGRAIYARARKRSRMDTVEFASAVRDAVAEERRRWEEEEARALTVVEERLEYFINVTRRQQQELAELDWHRRCHTAYAEYESQWHHRMRLLMLRAAANGGAISIDELPESIHFSDFEEQCRTRGDMNWRTWGIL